MTRYLARTGRDDLLADALRTRQKKARWAELRAYRAAIRPSLWSEIKSLLRSVLPL